MGYEVSERTKDDLQEVVADFKSGGTSVQRGSGAAVPQRIPVKCGAQLDGSDPPLYSATLQRFKSSDLTYSDLGTVWLRGYNGETLSPDTVYGSDRFGEYDPDPEGDSDSRPVFQTTVTSGEAGPKTCRRFVTNFDPDTCEPTYDDVLILDSDWNPEECSSSMAMVPMAEAVPPPPDWLRG